jgi:hypothetical protein
LAKEATTDTDGAAILKSQCSEFPPVPNAIQSSNFQYTYDVVVDPNFVPNPSTDSRFLTSMTESVHDKLTDQFMTCDYDRDSIWILQSNIHEVIEGAPCTTSDSPDCVKMLAQGRVLAYDSPTGNTRSSPLLDDGDYRRRRGLKAKQQQQQQHRRMQSNVADVFADEMLVFVEEGMSNGDFGVDGLTIETVFDGGEIVVVTPEPTESPTAPPTTSQPTQSPSSPTDSVTGTRESSENPGLAPPYIATIVVACAFVILLTLMAVSRRRKGIEQNDDDQESDNLVKFNVETIEIDRDLASQPSTGNYSGMYSPSSRGIESPGSRDPIVMASVSVGEEYEMDPFTSRSPSKRSKRGPLTSQDELELTFQESEEEETGNSRGTGISPRSYGTNDTVNL